MLTNLLPKTLRNSIFVIGMLMISASAAMQELGVMDPAVQAPEAKALQCEVVAPDVRDETTSVS